MGLQLIICVETNRRDGSDDVYIKSAIDHFYEIDQANNKLTFVYMNGKSRFFTPKVQKSIEQNIKLYKAAEDNESVVLCCFDCDEYENNPQDRAFLEKAQRYCDEQGYYLIWFCKDIEHVFLGKQIPNTKKTLEAKGFKIKKLIQKVNADYLRASHYQIHKSNMCAVLDQFLVRKDGDSL